MDASFLKQLKAGVRETKEIRRVTHTLGHNIVGRVRVKVHILLLFVLVDNCLQSNWTARSTLAREHIFTFRKLFMYTGMDDI